MKHHFRQCLQCGCGDEMSREAEKQDHLASPDFIEDLLKDGGNSRN